MLPWLLGGQAGAGALPSLSLPASPAQFHHRDPGIVGLLTSDQLPPGRHIFYGMIADGMHTNPAALRIAHRAHPQGEWPGWVGQVGGPSGIGLEVPYRLQGWCWSPMLSLPWAWAMAVTRWGSRRWK